MTPSGNSPLPIHQCIALSSPENLPPPEDSMKYRGPQPDIMQRSNTFPQG